jgi:RNA polymerase sigma-70 factor (ECF subfamily)
VDPDLQLLHAMTNGDTTALDTFYERHKPSMLQYLSAELNDAQLAEEVLQDVMLAVWKQAPMFRKRSKVRTWLFGIARRQAIRARQRYRPPMHEDLANLQVRATGNDPPTLMDEQVRQEQMAAKIGQLPANQQEALSLVFYHGMKIKEAADTVGVSESTMKVRLFRARKSLRHLLKEDEKPHA